MASDSARSHEIIMISTEATPESEPSEYTMGGHRLDDYPWTFYFNGHELPKWSGVWCLCRYDCKKIFKGVDNDRIFSEKDLWNIYYSIDHVGCAESYDWDLFCESVLEILIYHLKNKRKIIKTINKVKKEDSECGIDDSADFIYENISQGLEMMARISLKETRALWTNGYEEDRQNLITMIEQYECLRSSPKYIDLPHITDRAIDSRSNISEQFEIIDELKM